MLIDCMGPLCRLTVWGRPTTDKQAKRAEEPEKLDAATNLALRKTSFNTFQLPPN